jgi:DNA-binding GntR family transcriptional regulator
MKVKESSQVTHQAKGPAPRSLTSTLFYMLRKAVLFGQLEPGARMSAARLAQQYHVSLSAVREALARLAAEGLLEAEDHRGFRIARISKKELLDLTRARIDVECMALRRSIEFGDKAWEEKVKTTFGAMQNAHDKPLLPNELRSDLHAAFHLALLEACGSEWVYRICVMMFERAERYRQLATTYVKTRREVAGEHKRLFESVMKRDADKAVAILTSHIQETTKSLLDVEKDWPKSMLGPKQRKAGPARSSLARSAEKALRQD